VTIKELKELLAELPDELDDLLIYQYNGFDECSHDTFGIKLLRKTEDSKQHSISHTGDPAWEMEQDLEGNWNPKFPLIYIF